MMHVDRLGTKEMDVVILALDECYRRLEVTGVSARELTQDGFALMFKSAYQSMTNKVH